MKFQTRLKPTSALIDLTPLVDVVLLMLVFFLITSDILPLKSLNISPPDLPIEAPVRTSQILVVMDHHNVIYVGSQKEIVDLEAFRTSLEHEIRAAAEKHPGADLSVVLSVDREVEYGDFLRLFSEAQATGVKLRLVYNQCLASGD